MPRSSWIVAGALSIGCAGCIVIATDPSDTTGGATSGAGAGETGPCGGVPTEGECVSETRIRSCYSPESDAGPSVVEADCAPGTVCTVVDGFAQCKPKGDCVDGATLCEDASTLLTCAGGAWKGESCPEGTECVADPGKAPACGVALSDLGTGIFLRGHFEYELRRPKAALTGFEDKVSTEAGVDFLITVYDEGELIGLGLTSAGVDGLSPGDWKVELTRKPTDQTFYYFWPMLFGDDGLPRAAVAHAEGTKVTDQTSSKYWSWGFGPACASAGPCEAGDTGTQLVTEAEGSGAAYVYQWIDYNVFRLAELYPTEKPFSLVAFWEIDHDFDSAGAAFLPPTFGGASVKYDDGLYDFYESSIPISSSADSPLHWSKSLINHELGHWVQYSFSTPAREAAQHWISQPTKPGQSYDEAFATFHGQVMASKSPSDPDPIYFAKQQGTSWWFDIGALELSSSVVTLPNPKGPIDQQVAEGVIGGMMWSLWAESKAVAPQGLGDAALYDALVSERIMGGLNRGYPKIDFIDFADALVCSGAASSAQIAEVAKAVDYPWDGKPLCP